MTNKKTNDVNATANSDGVTEKAETNKRELRAFVKDLVRLTNLKRPRKSHYYELRGVLLSMGMSERSVKKIIKPFNEVRK